MPTAGRLVRGVHLPAEGADFCLRLQAILGRQLKAAGRLRDVYRYFEIALVPVLTRMVGMPIT